MYYTLKNYFLMFGSVSFSWLRCLDIKAFAATKRVKCVSDKNVSPQKISINMLYSYIIISSLISGKQSF